MTVIISFLQQKGVLWKGILILSSYSLNPTAKCHLTYSTEDIHIFYTICLTNIASVRHCHLHHLEETEDDMFLTSFWQVYDNLSDYISDL